MGNEILMVDLLGDQSGRWVYGGGGECSLVAQMVKNLPAMQETRVQFLRREDPPEKRKATHPSSLAWRIQPNIFQH